jgi:RNA polymerase sigma factor (sigma-70 family)
MLPRRQPSDIVARLFQARGADLLRYLRQRVRSASDAKDLAQEAYLRFIRITDPERLDNPEAYLFRIAANLLWEHQLRARKLQEHAPLPDTPVTEHTPLDLAELSEAAVGIRVALDELPLLPRSVLILHLRDGFTCAQIAAQTGISTAMVKKHLKKALSHCRAELGEFLSSTRKDR